MAEEGGYRSLHHADLGVRSSSTILIVITDLSLNVLLSETFK